MADEENPKNKGKLYNYTNKADKLRKENREYIKGTMPNKVEKPKYPRSELIYAEKLTTVVHSTDSPMYIYRIKNREENESAQIIQQKFREYFNYKKLIKLVKKRESSALTIQRWFRGNLCRLYIKELRREKTEGCLTIESVYHGYKSRQISLPFKEKCIKAIINYQRIYRGHAARKLAKWYKRYKKSLIKFQSYVRGYLTRNKYIIIKKQSYYENKILGSVINIQRVYRGYKGRENARKKRIDYFYTNIEIPKLVVYYIFS